MGGHLPGAKVTEEIARVRDKPVGQDVISPSRFEEIETKEDLRTLVSRLRDISGGRPIGIKLAAGRIEKDLEYVFCGTGFHHYRRPRRRPPDPVPADTGCHQRSYRLCSLPRKKLSGQETRRILTS